MQVNQPFHFSKDDLSHLAFEIVSFLKSEPSVGAKVFALRGDLGAGKTALVAAIGSVLGVADTVVSPTFTIMKVYETTDPVYTTLLHMDAYRIDDVAELRPLQFAEYLKTPHALFCIEWPEKIETALTEAYVQIELSIVDETTRTATISLLGVNSSS
jgi:tRNA threonylcarbamoyladenosine biosynthesis protein TsaE